MGSEFNNFLFATIGDDGKGGFLSVLSALARKNIDPWQEAAVLAGLPEETAVNRLASVIANFPDHMASPAGAMSIAKRLVALLPHVARTRLALPAATNSPFSLVYVVMLMLLAQLAITYFGPVFRHAPVKIPPALHASAVHHETSSNAAAGPGVPPKEHQRR